MKLTKPQKRYLALIRKNPHGRVPVTPGFRRNQSHVPESIANKLQEAGLIRLEWQAILRRYQSNHQALYAVPQYFQDPEKEVKESKDHAT